MFFRETTSKNSKSPVLQLVENEPTVGGTVINVRRPGIPEGIHIDIYQKLGVDYQNLPITKNLA